MNRPQLLFPNDYEGARARFHSLAAQTGFLMETHEHPDRTGPAGEVLACDVALKGAADADTMLLISSGTHGVEGFCGSGCQAELLASGLLDELPGGVAVVLVHAVNPYGFAWLRRTNEDNVDLNRNFVAHDREYPNPAYDEIHDWLVPQDWTGQARIDADANIEHYISSRGQRAFQAALSGGQYTHPDGLFYGGSSPAWSNLAWRGILRRHCANAARVIIMDIHTGLGPPGVGEAICIGDEDELHRAKALFGDDVTWIGGEDSVSTRVGGSLAHGSAEELGDGRLTMVALEYGTLPMSDTLEALRAENWLGASGGDPLGEHGRQIRQALKDAFYIDEPEWQLAVVSRFLDLVRRVKGKIA